MRVLRIPYADKVSILQQQLEKDNSVSFRHKNLQVLTTEMFKVFNGLPPNILNEAFT